MEGCSRSASGDHRCAANTTPTLFLAVTRQKAGATGPSFDIEIHSKLVGWRSMDAGGTYRYEATTVEGFVQQLAVCYFRNRYWFYVLGEVPEGKDPVPSRREAPRPLRGRAEQVGQGQGAGGAAQAKVQYLRYRSTFVHRRDRRRAPVLRRRGIEHRGRPRAAGQVLRLLDRLQGRPPVRADRDRPIQGARRGVPERRPHLLGRDARRTLQGAAVRALRAREGPAPPVTPARERGEAHGRALAHRRRACSGRSGGPSGRSHPSKANRNLSATNCLPPRRATAIHADDLSTKQRRTENGNDKRNRDAARPGTRAPGLRGDRGAGRRRVQDRDARRHRRRGAHA